MCSLEESALSKVTPRFFIEDLMGKVEGPSCRVVVREGEPMSKNSVLLWFSFKKFEDSQSEILLYPACRM